MGGLTLSEVYQTHILVKINYINKKTYPLYLGCDIYCFMKKQAGFFYPVKNCLTNLPISGVLYGGWQLWRTKRKSCGVSYAAG